jgi:hypothetical protein
MSTGSQIKEQPILSQDLQPSTGDQAIPKGTPPTQPQTHELSEENRELSEKIPIQKNAPSTPEPKIAGPQATPIEKRRIPEPEPSAPEPLTVPETASNASDAASIEENSEKSPGGDEPFLKLQPDVFAKQTQNNGCNQTKNPPEPAPPVKNEKTDPNPKPIEKKQIFKIIDPDNLFGGEGSKQPDKNTPNKKE